VLDNSAMGGGDKRYQQMYRYMEANRADVLMGSNEEGIQRVKRGGYVFLMESTSIDYAVERNCMLTQVGGTLDRKGYGIALRKGLLKLKKP
jgi:ionotropic glutamate receptor